jgi:hypothetical protein
MVIIKKAIAQFDKIADIVPEKIAGRTVELGSINVYEKEFPYYHP